MDSGSKILISLVQVIWNEFVQIMLDVWEVFYFYILILQGKIWLHI